MSYWRHIPEFRHHIKFSQSTYERDPWCLLWYYYPEVFLKTFMDEEGSVELIARGGISRMPGLQPAVQASSSAITTTGCSPQSPFLSCSPPPLLAANYKTLIPTWKAAVERDAGEVSSGSRTSSRLFDLLPLGSTSSCGTSFMGHVHDHGLMSNWRLTGLN